MKIGPSFNSGKPDVGSVRSDARPAPKAESVGTSPAASVRLSDLSSRLAEMEASLGTGPAFDAQRVGEIKQAIADGKFRVNTDAVADKLIANVREMLGVKAA